MLGENGFSDRFDFEWAQQHSDPFSNPVIRYPVMNPSPQDFGGSGFSGEGTVPSTNVYSFISQNWLWVLAALAMVLFAVMMQKEKKG